MKKIVSSIVILFITYASFGQHMFSNYKVVHYTSKNGMPTDFIMNAYQTKEGFIWMNTYEGYLRFDGKQFVNFNAGNTPLLKSNNNTSLFIESEDSTLWLPTGRGLLAYKNGQFKSYLSEFSNLFLQGVTKKRELLLTSSSSNAKTVYIKFDPATAKYDTGSIKMFLENRDADRFNVYPEAKNWTVRRGKIMRKGADDTWQTIGKKEGLNPDMLFGLDDLYVDSKNRVWVTSIYGLFVWEGSKFILFPGMENSKVPSPNPSLGKIAEDSQKGIWAPVGNTMAYLPDGATRFHFFPQEQLNIQTLHNITIDREQNIWLSTDRGLYKIYQTKVINYAESEGIDNNRVSGVYETSPGKLMISSATSKLYWLENQKITPYQPRSPKLWETLTNFICIKKDSKGNIWIGHQAGVLKITPKGETNIPAPRQVRFIEEAPDGKIYVAVSFTGIGVVNDKDQIEMLSYPGVDFSTSYFSSMRHLKDGGLLLTTYRTGAYILGKDGKRTTLNLFDDVEDIGIFNAYVKDDGVIWFATQNGLVKWDKGRVEHIDAAKSGLTQTAIFDILEDQQGNWWMPSNSGLIYASYSQIEQHLKNRKQEIQWRLIDESDGMNNRQCVGARYSCVAKDGKLYIVSIGGLVEIDPSKLATNKVSPIVRINHLRVDDSLFYLNGVQKIEPGNHRYVFDYSVLSLVAPERNTIYFRLIGQDDKWIRSSGDNRAFYTNLPPGTYRFEVKATNNDGVWCEVPAFFEFTVLPHFYQTVWFKIGCVLLALLAIWLLIRWRTRAAKLQNKKLEQQVAERTKELSESLSQLKSTQSQLVQSEKMASLGELTAGIAHEIQNPLNFVNNFSEVSIELLQEMKTELDKGNAEDAKDIATDVIQNLDKITYHGKRADSIVKGMLQHSRSSTGQKELTDINALCDEYLRLAYHGIRAKDSGFNVTLETDFDNTVGQVLIQPQEIGRVVLNLINNALYAVGDKKKLHKEGYIPTVKVATKRKENEFLISVEDNGGGIPDTIKEKIFQPFFTTKPTGQGTGLGLSLSYDIVKAHKGELKVESQEGIGTSFTITLPMNQ